VTLLEGLIVPTPGGGKSQNEETYREALKIIVGVRRCEGNPGVVGGLSRCPHGGVVDKLQKRLELRGEFISPPQGAKLGTGVLSAR